MSDTAPCPLCSTETDRILTRVLRRGKGIVFHCAGCDLGFLIAEKVDAKALYGGEYRKHASHHADGRPTNPQEIFDAYKNYQAQRGDMVLDSTKGNGRLSILEIGASAGQFLHYVDHAFARCCAIELDRDCCRFMDSLGIETDSNFLRESRFAKDKFDVVCSFQTMEHVEDPVAFLEDVRSVLKPDGVAFIECPNLREPLLSVWDIPGYIPFYFHSDHLWYFTERSLRRVAERAGFVNPDILFTQDYNLLSHLHWLMNGTPQPTCHIGLGPVRLDGKDKAIAEWLSAEMAALNERYVEKLVGAGATSNLMAVLSRTA